MSSRGGRLREVVAYESLDWLGQNVSWLAYANCRGLPHVLLAYPMLFMWKVRFKKKTATSHREISLSFTIQERDNVTTSLLSNTCSIVCQMVAYERLKVVAVAYERW